jgi:Bacterial regulatory protein, Fis family
MPLLFDDAIRAVISPDTRGSASRLLRFVAGYTRASAAALFEVGSASPALLVGVDATQETLDAANYAWERQRPSLEAGDLVRRKAQIVVAMRRHGRILGLLALDAPKADALDDVLRSVGPLLIHVVEAIRKAEQENPGEELRRLLEENEWNVARVARILGVSRVTVYARLDRYAIPRQRVLKGHA